MLRQPKVCMTDSPTGERSPFPSRRSLRAVHSSTPEARPEAPATPDASVASAAPAASQDPAPAQDPAPSHLVNGAAEYVRVPVREHVPAVPSEAATTPAAPRARWSFRRRVAGVVAAASVGGLFLSAAVPLLQDSEDTQVAAAQQQLFSEVSADEIPGSLSEITAVDVDKPIPGSYAFRARSLVNYPFTETVLLTDPFGYRTAPVEQFHDAQDFGAAAGTPIQAIADGKVLEAGSTTDGCGFGLKLEHDIDGKTVTSRYCHMQDASHSYQVGDEIKMGDPAGRVGATGMAFGAHLHLALRVDDEPVDPMPFLAKYSQMDRDEKAVAPTTTPVPVPTPAAD